MNGNLPALPNAENTLAIPEEFLSKLETREDYENAFHLVSESKNKLIWYEADIILTYYKKFNRQHLDVYRAGQLLDDSTVKYYLRTASAYPPEERLPNITFSHHYQASFADEWESQTLAFKGESRFLYIARAADEGMSTRRLRSLIEDDRVKADQQVTIIPCNHCFSTEGEMFQYFIYISKRGNTPHRLHLHPACYTKIMDYAHHGYGK